MPILEGWDDQSGEDFAQFHQAEARATIRTAIAPAAEALDAAGAELSATFGFDLDPPVYQGRVNLADGTWHTLVYDIDAETTASVMARQDGGRGVVISFVERDAAARTLMLTIAQADDSLADASPEIAIALESLAGLSLSELQRADSQTLPSGEWTVYAGESVMAMGMIFGNDAYVALQMGEAGDLAALAEAYNRTLLGFFITPDNSQYLALGLAVVFVILAALVGSLYWREKNVQKDLALLRELAREDE
ncbi:MAG: hypothetical protein OXG85_16010 [Chloroflexi bacterium]|nr:hypothetical protein [Chloroflexota bacterium]